MESNNVFAIYKVMVGFKKIEICYNIYAGNFKIIIQRELKF